ARLLAAAPVARELGQGLDGRGRHGRLDLVAARLRGGVAANNAITDARVVGGQERGERARIDAAPPEGLPAVGDAVARGAQLVGVRAGEVLVHDAERELVRHARRARVRVVGVPRDDVAVQVLLVVGHAVAVAVRAGGVEVPAPLLAAHVDGGVEAAIADLPRVGQAVAV